MKRIFYSDYGDDPARISRIETLIRALKNDGAEVCRTALSPLVSAAMVLPLPNPIIRPMTKAGIVLDKSVAQTDLLLRICADLFRSDKPNLTVQDCYTSMYLYRHYIERELEQFAPELVILWHQFSAYHYIIADWCTRKGVPVMYAEHGVLPGSWCFEFGGQMGESWISRAPETFAALPVAREDLRRAEDYLAHAVANRLNRKAGGISVAQAGLDAVLNADPRPKILYAGVNDFKTGLQPYSRMRTLLHTGDFVTTEAGLEALLPIARKNGWHVLYKPHPSIARKPQVPDGDTEALTLIPAGVDLVDLLPRCDALATIVSQSAYMALIHDRPVVLMGRLQLSGSGLVEEAPYNALLEDALHRALASRAVPRPRQPLVEHVARLVKYYLVAPDPAAGAFFPHSLGDLARALIDMPPAADRKRAG